MAWEQGYAVLHLPPENKSGWPTPASEEEGCQGEGGPDGGREGGRNGGREGGREGGTEGGREGGREKDLAQFFIREIRYRALRGFCKWIKEKQPP